MEILHWTIVARPVINPKENLSVELDEEFTDCFLLVRASFIFFLYKLTVSENRDVVISS